MSTMSSGTDDDENRPRKCDSGCPSGNIGANTNVNCRICKCPYHLSCYDIAVSPNRIFVSKNIVFICDFCMPGLDVENYSPDRKRKTAGKTHHQQQQQQTKPQLKQATLSFTKSSSSTGNDNNKSNGTKTIDELYELLSNVSTKLDKNSESLNGMEEKNHLFYGEMIETTTSTLNIVRAKSMYYDRFPKHRSDTVTTPNGTKQPRVYPNPIVQNTPKIKSFSTVLKSVLPVAPRNESPVQRKKEQHISLVDNASNTTIKTVKLPTPKQGKKDVQIGRPVEERQRQPIQRKMNPFTKSIWISKFHPETQPEELVNYIVEHTTVKDKSSFECVKLVKKDSDISTMSFVSFKINVTPEAFEVLIDPENWPQNKHVREWVTMAPPKKTLNDFVTNASTNSNENENEQQNKIDVESAALLNGVDNSNKSVNNNGNTMAQNSKNGMETDQRQAE